MNKIHIISVSSLLCSSPNALISQKRRQPKPQILGFFFKKPTRMEQPAIPNAVPQKDRDNTKAKKKIPTAQELISHYETQGLDSQQASIKVIEDLQNVVMRVISSNSKPKKDKFLIDTSRKIDSVNSRLAVVDMKLDSKPGYLETFAIGIASGAALNGMGSVLPHVFEGFAQIWSAVRTATKPSSSP